MKAFQFHRTYLFHFSCRCTPARSIIANKKQFEKFFANSIRGIATDPVQRGEIRKCAIASNPMDSFLKTHSSTSGLRPRKQCCFMSFSPKGLPELPTVLSPAQPTVLKTQQDTRRDSEAEAGPKRSPEGVDERVPITNTVITIITRVFLSFRKFFLSTHYR